MMKRLSNYWDAYQASKLIEVEQPIQVAPKKKGRPFKNKQ
jgi:hypothetical protein